MKHLYTVYFELYGKKMKATVEATSEDQARYLIMGKVIFHKIIQQDRAIEELFPWFRNTK